MLAVAFKHARRNPMDCKSKNQLKFYLLRNQGWLGTNGQPREKDNRVTCDSLLVNNLYKMSQENIIIIIWATEGMLLALESSHGVIVLNKN